MVYYDDDDATTSTSTTLILTVGRQLSLFHSLKCIRVLSLSRAVCGDSGRRIRERAREKSSRHPKGSQLYNHENE